MKATLEFNLPEDEFDYNMSINGFKWFNVTYQLDQHLRSQLKYNELTEEQARIYEELRELLREKMIEQGVNFD